MVRISHSDFVEEGRCWWHQKYAPENNVIEKLETDVTGRGRAVARPEFSSIVKLLKIQVREILPQETGPSRRRKFSSSRNHVRTVRSCRMEQGATSGTYSCNSLNFHDMECHFLHRLFNSSCCFSSCCSCPEKAGVDSSILSLGTTSHIQFCDC